jgi:hypothetical protein
MLRNTPETSILLVFFVIIMRTLAHDKGSLK